MFLDRRQALLGELRARVAAIERAGPAAVAAAGGAGGVCSLGDPVLDGALPWGGLPQGALHEVAGQGVAASAAAGFAAALAARLAGHVPGLEGQAGHVPGLDGQAGHVPGPGGSAGPEIVLWCQAPAGRQEAGEPYGPGLAAFGLDRRRLILLCPRRAVDLLWALEEGLRCPGVGVVLGEVGAALDLRASRRLQLAAEAGGAAGILFCPSADGLGPSAAGPSAAGPSAALTRWRVAGLADPAGRDRPIAARWAVELWRCRGAAPCQWTVDWDEQALRFTVAAALADRPAEADRAARSA